MELPSLKSPRYVTGYNNNLFNLGHWDKGEVYEYKI